MKSKQQIPDKKEKIKEEALNKARAVAPKYCERCGGQYTDDSFKLVQKNDKHSVFHLKCAKCANTYMLNVVSPAPNLMASQRSSLNIDLDNVKEMSKFAGKVAVSEDEALDIANTLKDADIAGLISK